MFSVCVLHHNAVDKTVTILANHNMSSWFNPVKKKQNKTKNLNIFAKILYIVPTMSSVPNIGENKVFTHSLIHGSNSLITHQFIYFMYTYYHIIFINQTCQTSLKDLDTI